MKAPNPSAPCLVLALACGLLPGPALGQTNLATPKTAAAPLKSLAILPPAPGGEIPKSVFVIPAQPHEGRDPFFPAPKERPSATKPAESPQVVDTMLVLNGITSPPKATAMINGRTFEAGEEGEIRLSTGAKVRVKCERIGKETAVILINGQRRELRMRAGI